MKRKRLTKIYLTLICMMVLFIAGCGSDEDQMSSETTMSSEQITDVENEVTETETTEIADADVEENIWDPSTLTLMNGKVTFGSYEQDNNLANGDEPISWNIADSKDGNILLISEYVLDVRAFHPEEGSVNWETAEIRQWLNGEFLAEAFSEDEQMNIVTTLIETTDIRGDEYTTEDKVFLLSAEETSKYFTYDTGISDLMRKTARAEKKSGVNMAWLRSVGQLGTQSIKDDGTLEDGCVRTVPAGIRPAIWVTPNESLLTQMEAAGVKIPEYKVVERDIQIGDYIRIGTFEQNNIEVDGKEPIEWQVLDIIDDKALLISRYTLEYQSFAREGFLEGYSTSNLRNWLTDIFYNAAFTEEEKDYMVYTKVMNDHPWGDYIFALSKEQADTYGVNTYSDGETAYVKALKKILGMENDLPCWWTRTYGSDWVFVMPEYREYQHNLNGVRPAMWIELSMLDAGISNEEEQSEAADKLTISTNQDGYVVFGSYEQDNDVNNGAEPIEWIVLEEMENEFLLMSRYGLDTKDYYPYEPEIADDEHHITWEMSSVRSWLNNEFYNTAFSDDEKSLMCINNIQTSRYDITIDDMVDITVEDYVYILNYDEAYAYDIKYVKATEFALSQGATNVMQDGSAPWLVRNGTLADGLTTWEHIINSYGKSDYFILGGGHAVVCPVIKVRFK